MTTQREQNPDVNSYQPSGGTAENTGPSRPDNSSSDVEKNHPTDVIPVPPDSEPTAPVEDPPRGGNVPVGDVDDSPKKIV